VPTSPRLPEPGSGRYGRPPGDPARLR